MAKLTSGTRIYGNTTIDTFLVVSGNSAANSISTGAIKVSGGIGANGNVYSTGFYESGVSTTTRLFDSANLVINAAVSSNVATLRGEITGNVNTLNASIAANATSSNSVINANISANVATLRGEITANAVSANSVINTNISANVATLRGEITANAVSANSVINTNISANVATLRGEITSNVSTLNGSITANAASANSVINTNISANVATLRGEITSNVNTLNSSITANAVSANSVINTNISANVATINGSITTNVATLNGSISTNVATLRGEISANATTVGNQANAAYAKANLAITINTTEGISVTGTANLGSTITINNTGVKGIYVGARLTANAATGNVLLDLNTTSVIAGSYTYPSLQVDAYGRITTITNQQPVLSLTANASTVTVSNSTGAISVGLPALGTAGTYGGVTAIPSFTTDAYGRITAIANTSVSFVSKTGDTMTGALVIANTTASTSNSTGALIVNGGVGISGNVFAQGNNATWAAVSNTSGYQMSMAVNDQLGSLGVGWGTKDPGQAGAFMYMSASGGKNFIGTQSRDFYLITGSGVVPFYVFSSGNNAIQQSNTTITSTIASNSNTSGALIVAGGVGVTGNVYVGSGSVVGFSNSTSVSAAYQYYNAATNSLDTVFG